MFNLIYANDADALLDRLAQALRKPAHGATPLAPEIVLVPQFGLRRWLEIRLAETLGVIANIAFYAPAEYAWALLRAANPDLAETDAFEREVLRWRIFALLPSLLHAPELAAALADGEISTRLRLADDLAHFFERHLAYRADELARWQRGTDRDDWRADLWRALTRQAPPHRADLLTDYHRRYAATAPPQLPARLFAFACTNISPDLLRFYGLIAQHTEMSFLMPNPCSEYWGEVRTLKQRLRDRGDDALLDADNPLLAANGRAGRDFVHLLFEHDWLQTDEDSDCSRAPAGTQMLARVQRDVLSNLVPQASDAIAPDDTSIQFHICHSRLREVEVLHDRLLDLFARQPALLARDVAVMTPDIAAYAPYIHAVFGAFAADDARRLPYQVSDASARETHALVACALDLAALPLSRRQLSEVIELLAVPAVARRVALDAADIAQLETWLRNAGVRWGTDEAQRAALGAGRYRDYTWAAGLDRLLLGIASGEEDELIGGIAADAAVEGSATRLIDALLHVLRALDTLAAEQTRMHSAARWQEIYNAAFTALFDGSEADRDERRALDRVREALAELAGGCARAGVDEPLDWQCVRDFLVATLSTPERSYRFFSGGINICGMLPLRAVPFKVLCLIGMNEGFPRRDEASALARDPAPRRGEPSRRLDDRYLFLQLLCSAREVFYLSWVGEAQRDGSAQEPSAVVTELLDVLAHGYVGDAKRTRAQLVFAHPLQPFSPRLFDSAETRLFTYRSEWRRAAPAAVVPLTHTVCASAPLAGPIEFDDVREFWRAPGKVYLRDRLDIRLEHAEDAAADEDPLHADGLQMYTLRRSLAARLIDLNRVDRGALPTAATLRARALLPVGRLGAAAFDEACEQAVALAAAVLDSPDRPAPAPPQPFELVLDAAALQGLIPAQDVGGALIWHAGALHGSRLFDAWLHYLVLAARHETAVLRLIGLDKGKPVVRQFTNLTPEGAKKHLSDLLQIYRDGVDAPILFFPKSSFAYAHALTRAKDEGDQAHFDALTAAEAAFADEAGRERAFERIARDLAIFDPAAAAADEFAGLAWRVFAPMLNVLGGDRHEP